MANLASPRQPNSGRPARPLDDALPVNIGSARFERSERAGHATDATRGATLVIIAADSLADWPINYWRMHVEPPPPVRPPPHPPVRPPSVPPDSPHPHIPQRDPPDTPAPDEVPEDPPIIMQR